MTVRHLLATGFGSGYAPLAPGTFGSLVGLLLFWPLAAAGSWLPPLAATAAATALGFWSAGPVAAELGSADPGPIVIDEIAGQMLTLLLLPPTWKVFAAGFVLFRLFDVLKPFPARRLESLPGASGIMSDDLMAAVYANLLLQLLCWRWPQAFGA